MRNTIIAIALLASTTLYAEDKQEDIGFFEALGHIVEGMTANNSADRFIATHGEQFRIENGRVYNGSGRKYLESKGYYDQSNR